MDDENMMSFTSSKTPGVKITVLDAIKYVKLKNK